MSDIIAQGESVIEARLFVGNLSHTTSEDDLSALFAHAGQTLGGRRTVEAQRRDIE